MIRRIDVDVKKSKRGKNHPDKKKITPFRTLPFTAVTTSSSFHSKLFFMTKAFPSLLFVRVSFVN